jgi:hypothetical protein
MSLTTTHLARFFSEISCSCITKDIWGGGNCGPIIVKSKLTTSAIDNLFYTRALTTIPEETLQHFRESAQMVIDERGALDALAAAMAVITGNTEIKSRSLLTSKEVIFDSFMRIRNELFLTA